MEKIAKHFTDLLMIVLIIASLKFASSEYIEGSIILFVVIVNGLVSYWQERKAEESLNGLKQLMGQEAIVLSNGMQENPCERTSKRRCHCLTCRRRRSSRCSVDRST